MLLLIACAVAATAAAAPSRRTGGATEGQLIAVDVDHNSRLVRRESVTENGGDGLEHSTDAGHGRRRAGTRVSFSSRRHCYEHTPRGEPTTIGTESLARQIPHHHRFEAFNEKKFTVEIEVTPKNPSESDVHLSFSSDPKLQTDHGFGITVSWRDSRISVRMADGLNLDAKSFQGWDKLPSSRLATFLVECWNLPLAGGRDCRVAVNGLVWDGTRHFSNVTGSIYSRRGTNLVTIAKESVLGVVKVCLGELPQDMSTTTKKPEHTERPLTPERDRPFKDFNGTAGGNSTVDESTISTVDAAIPHAQVSADGADVADGPDRMPPFLLAHRSI